MLPKQKDLMLSMQSQVFHWVLKAVPHYSREAITQNNNLLSHLKRISPTFSF